MTRSPASMIACSTSTDGRPHLRTAAPNTTATGLLLSSHSLRDLPRRKSRPSRSCSRNRRTNGRGITRPLRKLIARSNTNTSKMNEQIAMGIVDSPPSRRTPRRLLVGIARSPPLRFPSASPHGQYPAELPAGPRPAGRRLRQTFRPPRRGGLHARSGSLDQVFLSSTAWLFISIESSRTGCRHDACISVCHSACRIRSARCWATRRRFAA